MLNFEADKKETAILDSRAGGNRHFTPMAEFTPAQITQALGLARDFFGRVDAAGHPEAVYHFVNWNHMPPAGSSLIHSHLQVFSSSNAPNLLA
jgi:UDPglucose--hexose-1-phosphate uridylyltransferase